jgi:hypothetical protein
MIADVAGSIACDYAADRIPLPGGLVHGTDLRPGQVVLRAADVRALGARVVFLHTKLNCRRGPAGYGLPRVVTGVR